MQPAPSPRELYPHRELGIALLAVGIGLFLVAILLGSDCQTTAVLPGGSAAQCSYYPYVGAAIALGALGFTLILSGLIFVVLRAPAPMAPFPMWAPAPMPSAYAPGAGLPPPPPAAPSSQWVACKSCGRVYPATAFAFCPSCGSKLGG